MLNSARFLLWYPEGTICLVVTCIFDFIRSFVLSKHSLSMTCFFTSTPAYFSLLNSARQARRCFLSDLLFSVAASTVLLSIVTITMMYLAPVLALVGNFPVWSVYMVPFISHRSTILEYTSLSLSFLLPGQHPLLVVQGLVSLTGLA